MHRCKTCNPSSPGLVKFAFSVPGSTKAARGRTSHVLKRIQTSHLRLSSEVVGILGQDPQALFISQIKGKSRNLGSTYMDPHGRVSPPFLAGFRYQDNALRDTPGGTMGLPATGFTSRPPMPRYLAEFESKARCKRVS